TGNTLNMMHPHVLQLMMDSLRYWVLEMRVDGFRFDLASALARELHDVNRLGSFFDLIQQDPVINRVKLIAEPWDVGEGGYQVGNFPPLWSEWNGKYRDSVRDFWRGTDQTLAEFGSRFTGSSDLYQGTARRPYASVNFITAHDGFTLKDLVSYNDKHNEANGEENRDGANDNRSWNCGVEGPTDDPQIEALRNRQVKNFLTVTFLSLGVPMILMGDEMRRTQHGNNNAYCRDDADNWLDWTLLEKHGDVHRFVSLLAARRSERSDSARDQRISLTDMLEHAKTAWHGVKHLQPDWSPTSHALVFGAELRAEGIELYLIMNAYWEPLEFELPPLSEG